MKLCAQAQALLTQYPLPDNAPEQLAALTEQASDEETILIEMLSEALYQLATPAQLSAWENSSKP